MPVHFDREKGRWRFSFRRRVDGNRYQLTKLLPKGWSQRQAEAYDRTECARLYAQASGIETPRLPIANAVQFYLDHRCPQLRNGKKAAQDLEHLLPEIEGGTLDQLAKIATDYDINNRAKLAPATIRNRLAYLKAAVRYAYRKHGYGDRDYTDKMVLPTVDNERQVYAKLPDLNRLWQAFKDPEARSVFRMAFYLGVRWRADLLPRVPADIEHRNGEAWLKIGLTKNGTPRMVPIHPAITEDLKRLPIQQTDRELYDHWWEATEAIGRPDLRPHDLRHSLASEIISRGGSLEDVRGALHHKSLQASRRYSHIYPERVRSVMLKVGENIAHPETAPKRWRRAK